MSALLMNCSGAWTRKTTWIALAITGPLAGWFFGYVHQSARSAFWNDLMVKLGATELASGDTAKAYLLCAGGGLIVALLAGLALVRLPGRLMQELPSVERLDELNYLSVATGFPSASAEVEIVRHESGVNTRTAKSLVELARRVRRLKEQGLTEGPGTRLLVAAGRLIADGIPPLDACRAAVIGPLTDDPDLLIAIGDLVSATL